MELKRVLDAKVCPHRAKMIDIGRTFATDSRTAFRRKNLAGQRLSGDAHRHGEDCDAALVDHQLPDLLRQGQGPCAHAACELTSASALSCVQVSKLVYCTRTVPEIDKVL